MITKQTIIDKIEIVGPHKIIQVREAEVILEDGVEIARKLHRHCVCPDETSPLEEVQAIANVVHTKKVKDDYKAQKQK